MPKHKLKWETRDVDRHGNPHHYFATSVAEWMTDTNLESLIQRMKVNGFPFFVYRVKLPETAAYGIESYVPKLPDDQIDYVGGWE